jgi:hypothetical protein
MDRDEISNLYRGPSIYASYQISDQLALRFQRRRLKCEKLTDNGRRTPSDGKNSLCLWQGELKKSNTHHTVELIFLSVDRLQIDLLVIAHHILRVDRFQIYLLASNFSLFKK